MTPPKGYLALVLHAHLPFVRHPEDEETLEEDWLYEAITETYLPLLRNMDAWSSEGIPWRLTMSLTPTLCSMLADELLQTRYLAHLDRLIELADREADRTRSQPEFHAVSQMYQRLFRQCRSEYVTRYQRDLLGAFRLHQDAGNLEILTCSATHGFMPLLQRFPEAVHAQHAIAVEHYKQTFGRAPRGIWNAECGYYPGLDEVLARHGLKYFFMDSHGLLFADKRPKYGVFAPLRTPAGPAAFGRDQESSRSVWSAEHGYPGDARYREFYRDIGFDLDLEYLRPYIHSSGLRIATGIKYHRITRKGGLLQDKEPYREGDAREAAAANAGHFLFCRQQQVLHLSTLMPDRPPLIVSPYDAELFGHWWFEGPQFLDFLVRKMHYDQDDLKMITPTEYLEKHPDVQTAKPAPSSWGFGGYNEVWLEGSNDWIYRHTDQIAERMTRLAERFPDAAGLELRALNQAARELLLAQASDWAFIMKTNTVVDYAIQRIKDHVTEFLALEEMLLSGRLDEGLVAQMEERDNLFPHLDYRVYRLDHREATV
jgi:1,4-alpha-glucan branching enzyme